MKKTLFTIAAVIALLTACTKDPSISVTPASLDATYEGGTFTTALSANGKWSATTSNAAVTVSPVSGTGDSPVSITVAPNTDNAFKTFEVLFICDKDGKLAEFTVAISQTAEGASIGLAESSTTVGYEGGECVAEVISVYAWTASTDCEELTITPTSGESGTTQVHITVPANTTTDELTHIVTFTSEGESATYTIIQTNAAAPEISIDPQTAEFDYEAGSSCEFTVTANYDWTFTCDEGITVTALDENTAEVTVNSMNTTNDPLTFKAYFVSSVNDLAAYDTITVTQNPATVLSYGDVDYKIKWLADGNLWMCENLRYVPEGMTISETVGDDNGVWYSCGTDKTFQSDPDSVAVKGLLYNCETAFGGVTITENNFSSFEGVQGICPEGWHIPTGAELVNLVGKGVGELETKTDAPYYDPATGKSSVDLANADGFNIATYGYRNQNNVTTNGSYLGVLYNGKLSSDFIMGSSTVLKNGEPTYTPMGTDDPSVKNVQYYGLMPFINASNNSLNIANCNFKSGVHVRCVMNAE